jgi:predicted N-formylglutamate amidohydrolase
MSRRARAIVVVTCEHGGNRIPSECADLFRGWTRVLVSHRGHDPGALVMARELASALHAPLVAATVSRLVVDLNRTLSNRSAWSDATRHLSMADKECIAARYYFPYRNRVDVLVGSAVAAGHRVIHLSSHSFTPVLDGEVRNADIGLLYDPARSGEVAIASRWKAALAEASPGLRVRRNYPYAGRNDGLTSSLRRRFPASRYVGIELEVNQAIVLGPARPWRHLRRAMVSSLQAVLH